MTSLYDVPGSDIPGFGNNPEVSPSNVSLDPIGSLQQQGSQFSGWGDLGHQLTASTGDMGSLLSGVVGYIANKVDPSDSNVVATTMDAWRKGAADWAAGERDKVSPTTMALMQGPALESLGRNPMWWLAGQTAAMVPTLVGATATAALVGMAAPEAVAGAATSAATFAAFGTLSAGDAIDQINSAIDNVSDAQLQSIHPLYKKYRQDGDSEAEARRKLSGDVAGLAPAVAFAVGGASALVGGPGQLARLLNRSGTEALVGGGIVKRFIGGAAVGAAANAAGVGTSVGVAQTELDRTGIQPFDTSAVVNAAIGGAAVGAAMGGIVEAAVPGHGGRSLKEPTAKPGKAPVAINPEAIGPDPVQAAALDAARPAPAQPPAATAVPGASAIPDRRAAAPDSVGDSVSIPPGAPSVEVPTALTSSGAAPKASPRVVQDRADEPPFVEVMTANNGRLIDLARLVSRDGASVNYKTLVSQLWNESRGMSADQMAAHIEQRLVELANAQTTRKPAIAEGSRPSPPTADRATSGAQSERPAPDASTKLITQASSQAPKGRSDVSVATLTPPQPADAGRRVVTDKTHRAVFTSVTAAANDAGQKISTALRDIAKLSGRNPKELRAELQDETRGMRPEAIRAHIGARLAGIMADLRRRNPQIGDAVRGAHITAAERDARNALNTAATKAVERVNETNPPGGDQAAIKARVKALTEAYFDLGKPENGGHKLPQRDKRSVSGPNLNDHILLMLEAKLLHNKIASGRSRAADYQNFVTNENLIRLGRAEDVRESRRAYGNERFRGRSANPASIDTFADALEETPSARVTPAETIRRIKAKASEVRRPTLSDEEKAAILTRAEQKAGATAQPTSEVVAPAAPPKGKVVVERIKSKAKAKAGTKDSTKPATKITAPVAERVAKAAKGIEKPTEAQKESGNYTKGHVSIQGLPITIETPKGATRSGVGPDGKPWSVKMPDHYGYVKRTEGADGDHVDVYIGPHPDENTVYVVDQNDADTGKFDEHKAMIGYSNAASAMEAYSAAFSDGRAAERFGGVTPMTMDEFKAWLKSPETKKPTDDHQVLSEDLAQERGARLDLVPEPREPNPYVSAYNDAVRWLNGLSDADFVRLRELWGDDLGPELEATEEVSDIAKLRGEWQKLLGDSSAGTPVRTPSATKRDLFKGIRVPPAERRDQGPGLDVQRLGRHSADDTAYADTVIHSTVNETRALKRATLRTSTLASELPSIAQAFLQSIGSSRRSVLDAAGELGFTRGAPDAGRGVTLAMMPVVIHKLQALAGDTPVHFVDPAKFDIITYSGNGRIGGVYYRAEHAIYVPDGPVDGQLAHTLLHEGAHAAFLRALTKDRVLRDAMLEIIEDAKAKGAADPASGGTYALSNMDEFLAEALSNPRFQRWLAKAKASDGVKSALALEKTDATIWGALVRLARRLFGLPGASDSLLHAVLKVVGRLDEQVTGEGGARRMGSHDLHSERAALARDREHESNSWYDRMLSELEEQIDETSALPTAHAASPLRLEDIRGGALDVVDTLRGNSTAEVGWSKGPLGVKLKLRTMDQIAAAAKSLNLFRPVGGIDPVRAVFNAVQRIASKAHQIEQSWAPELVHLKHMMDKYRGPQADEFAKLMVDSTIAGVWPDRPLTDKANAHITKNGYTDAWERAQHAVLAARFDALPHELKDTYSRQAKHYADAQNSTSLGVIQNRLLTALGVTDKDLADRLFAGTETDADKARLGDAYDLIKDANALTHIKGPYFPLMRHGKYVVRGYHGVAEPTSGAPGYVGRESGAHDAAYVFNDAKAAKRFATYDETGRVRDLKPTVESKIVDKGTGSPWGVMPDGSRVRLTIQDTNAERRYYVRIRNQHTEFVDSLRAARTLAHTLEQDGLKNVDVQAREYEPGRLQGAFMSSDLRKVAESIEKGDAYKAMTDEQKREVQLALDQVAIRLLGENRIQSRSLPRRNVAGASKDVVRNAAIYNHALSGYLARLAHGTELDGAMDELQKQARTNDGTPGSLGRMDVYNEIKSRVHADARMTGDLSEFSPAIRRIMQVSFIDKLMSPANSVINATQPAMLTFPMLAGRHGVGGSLRALSRAYSDIGALDMFRTGLKDTLTHAKGQTERHTGLTDVLLARARNDGERRMLQHLIDTNSISPDAGFEVASLVPDSSGVVGKIDDLTGYLSGIARQMPRAVEAVNRGVSALAAYRLEMQRTSDHNQAVEYAQHVTNMTQGIYNSQNAPKIFSHPLAALSLQFKKYGQMVYGLLGHEIGRAIYNLNPGDRAEALKSLATMAAMHMAVAGALGLPTEPFKWMLIGANAFGITSTTWNDVENWERSVLASILGKELGEVASRGLTRAIPGGLSFDLSRRLGMEDLITFGAPQSSSQDDLSAFLWTQVAGAPGGLGMDYFTGAQQVLGGDYAGGIAKFVPIKMVSDSIAGAQKAFAGKVSRSGNDTMSSYSLPEAIVRGFGFTPGRDAETSDMNSAMFDQTQHQRGQRTDFEQSWYKAQPADRMKLWGQIERWNTTQPAGNRLTRSQLTEYTKRRQRDLALGRTFHGLSITKGNRSVVDEVMATFNS